MASVVDICNLALSHLGDDATVSSIDPPEGSQQAEHCKRFYPIARDMILEAHMWGFATKRKELALLSDVSTDEWEFAYQFPADCLSSSSILNVFATDTFDGEGSEYVVEATDTGTVIFTNAEDAHVRYVARVTDTTKYPPQFVNALSYLLSSQLAGPVVKGETGMKVSEAMFKMYLMELGKAQVSDSSARRYTPNHNPEFMGVRSQTGIVPPAWIKRS
jgi:hypothetical protein